MNLFRNNSEYMTTHYGKKLRCFSNKVDKPQNIEIVVSVIKMICVVQTINILCFINNIKCDYVT